MIRGHVIGTVKFAGKIVEPGENKKPFLACVIEDARTWGDKTYRTSVNCLMYGRDIEAIAPKLTVGTIACCDGEVSIDKREKDGKQYHNIKIVGNIEALGVAAKAPPASAPARQTQAAAIETEEIPF